MKMTPELIEVARIVKDVLEIPDVPLKVRKLIVKLCNAVTCRAARLAAAGIGGMLKKMGLDGSCGITGGRTRSDVKMRRTVVAIRGSLYSSYTTFRKYLHEALWEISGEDIAPHVILKVIEDGSGIGAALLAATYSKGQCVWIAYSCYEYMFNYIQIAPVNVELFFHIFLYKGRIVYI